MNRFLLPALALLLAFALPLPATEPATGDRNPAQALRPKLVTGTEPIPPAPDIAKLIADVTAARTACADADAKRKAAEVALATAWKDLSDKIAALGLQPPPPPDEFDGEMTAAIKADTPHKALTPILVEFYRACPNAIDNLANDSTGKLLNVLLKTRQALIPDDKLVATRHAVDKQIVKALGGNAQQSVPMTPEIAAALKAVFAKAVAKLEKP